jgi:ferredoxin-NADP reductase
LIAGGIGITPLMSMLRHMHDTAQEAEVVLLYANRHEEDIVFADELTVLAAQAPPHLRVVHVLSAPSAEWGGRRGHIDRAFLAAQALEDLPARACYVCGPPRMMAAVNRSLQALGVPASRIYLEHFAL